jgi:ABC-type enterobactin transport system permease subunit
MEVPHRQKQFVLLAKPRGSAVCAALTACAIATRMVTCMLGTAVLAAGDVPAHLLGAAPCNVAQRTGMTGQHGSTEPQQIVRPMPANHVG